MSERAGNRPGPRRISRVRQVHPISGKQWCPGQSGVRVDYLDVAGRSQVANGFVHGAYSGRRQGKHVRASDRCQRQQHRVRMRMADHAHHLTQAVSDIGR
jgi:hypothetical protein